jgi:flagellar basal-body rod modification protein FlgD
MSTVTSNPGSTSVADLMSTMNAKATGSGTSSVTDQADKFMTLLVTQMKNQDPLNPLDNAQVTSQLAQLSTVEGVNKLNTTLGTLMSSYQTSATLQAASLIGRGVLVDGSTVSLQGGKAVFGVQLDSAADNVQVEVSDRKGKVVQTIDLGANPAGTMPLAWDGIPDASKLDENGKPVQLADGQYTFKVVATRAGQQLADAHPLSYDSVVSVSTNAADGVKLNLPGKGMVALSEIKQVL